MSHSSLTNEFDKVHYWIEVFITGAHFPDGVHLVLGVGVVGVDDLMHLLTLILQLSTQQLGPPHLLNNSQYDSSDNIHSSKYFEGEGESSGFVEGTL